MNIQVFPVVHVRETAQAMEQSAAALENGADGVYLIDHHHADTTTLLQSFNEVSAEFPENFVGLNFLQHASAAQSFAYMLESRRNGTLLKLPSGLWVDNADAEKHDTQTLRGNYPELRGIQYLGGVAFKYTSLFTENPEVAAAEAVRLQPFVDVVTTSGAGTGKAPSPDKIAAMKQAIGGAQLAVASGITTENLADYGELFDQLLVSTSIETAPYSGIFDVSELRKLVDLAHGS